MPPKYQDGTFKRRRQSGLIEYRFMYDNKQKSVYGHSEQECFNKRTELITGKVKNNNLKQQQTFGDWLEKWYVLYKIPRNNEKSLTQIRTYLDNEILPALGKIHLTKLDGATLQEFINKYTTTANTQEKISIIIKGSLEKARKLGYIKINPFDAVDLAYYKATSYRAFEFAEQLKIYSSIDIIKYRKIFMLACCTGIRIGRLLELDNKNFDFDRMEITIIKKQKKGLNETYKVPFLMSLLDDLPKSGKLFDIGYSGARIYFDKLFRKLNITNASLHCCRDTFASVCNFLNINEKQIQLWMGHATLKMTQDTYMQLLKSNASSPILDYLKALKESLSL